MSKSNFEMWFYTTDGKKEDITLGHGEQLFFDVTGGETKDSNGREKGIKIKSLKSFISWLILKKYISNLIKVKGEKPLSLISLSPEEKIATLVKNIKNIRELAIEFNKVFGDIDNKKVD